MLQKRTCLLLLVALIPTVTRAEGLAAERPLNHSLLVELWGTIPSGERAITSLALGPDGKIYGATSGNNSHIFSYAVG